MPLNYCLDIFHISDCYCWSKNAFKLLFRYLSDCYCWSKNAFKLLFRYLAHFRLLLLA